MTLELVLYSSFQTPLGKCAIARTGRGLLGVSLSSRPVPFKAALRRGRELRKVDNCFPEAKEQLLQYLNGERTEFELELDLSTGTSFQQEVWQALRRIPYGETRSYRWLAEVVGRPRAHRAVGQANGRNPVPIIIPCHRVIAADGSIGGYTGGLGLKKKLLALEQPG